ncbi:hybrid sensor histidine kinase/response regulator [Novosphingobium olei]|uniref:histidine kinase n=1 Tax=Novosphingobium olei TaxID=2728851 RepID=A0A7Y0BMK6_9SPHN|nr:hybrid sensor histidine kinase/response regulator [Novosphingobium olei]NML93252.1 response regulator [Novosphingobium olei]
MHRALGQGPAQGREPARGSSWNALSRRAGRAVSTLRRLVRRDAIAAGGIAGRIAELERACAVAEAASAAKSRYLANVSHEIRSPLNAIYGYAQLIERGSGVDAAEAAKVIRRSAEHLTDLVEGLLDISLVENGVTRVASDVVRLPAFIDQLARMFAPSAEAKGLVFEVDLPLRLPEFVRTDQKRLRQVLINLVSNAIKFTDTGTVTLRVRRSGETTRFEVEDTGPGIAPEDRERVFAPFERGEGEEGRSSGFGLGLPITRAIVQILGGDIAVTDGASGGACFRVSLMLNEVRVEGTDKPDLGRIVGYAGARRQVLAVDDDIRQLSFVRQALEDVDFDVSIAPDGETAIALCDAQAFDLVLLDVQMGGQSGWETASHLRSVHGRSLKIVMLSANAHERHGPAADDEELPHDLFLLKPVEIGQLIDAIGRQLGLQWVREGGTPRPMFGKCEELPEAALAHVAKLRELVRIGHVRGIEAEIRALEKAAPECGTLAATLYACLDRFDLAALARKLEGL